MSVPELFLFLLLLATAWVLADAGRQLWRRQARNSRGYADVLIGIAIVWVTTSLHASKPHDLIAKVAIATLITAAVILRLVARKRFPVQA